MEGAGRSLIIFAHPDGEPVAGTERWAHEPFAAEVADGRMIGWGVADDLMGVAAGVCPLDVLQAQGVALMASTPTKRHANGVTKKKSSTPRNAYLLE